MTMRFANLTDFAQPAHFWQKYKTKSGPRSKRRRVNDDGDYADGEDSADSNSDTDNELPLERHKSSSTATAGGERRGSFDLLATELIFQPLDW